MLASVGVRVLRREIPGCFVMKYFVDLLRLTVQALLNSAADSAWAIRDILWDRRTRP